MGGGTPPPGPQQLLDWWARQAGAPRLPSLGGRLPRVGGVLRALAGAVRAGMRRRTRAAGRPVALERLGYLPLTARRGLWLVRIGHQVWALAVHEHGMVPFGPLPWEEDEQG